MIFDGMIVFRGHLPEPIDIQRQLNRSLYRADEL